jgi:hypothetical protein
VSRLSIHDFWRPSPYGQPTKARVVPACTCGVRAGGARVGCPRTAEPTRRRSPTRSTNRLRDRTTPPQHPRHHSMTVTPAIGLAAPAFHATARFRRRRALLLHQRWPAPPHGARRVGRTNGIEVRFLPYVADPLPRMPLQFSQLATDC